MGALTEDFHFLGINFKVNNRPADRLNLEQVSNVKKAETQIQFFQSQVTIALHERCCARALDKISVIGEDIVHPMQVRRYLYRWAFWCPVQHQILAKTPV
jgi:hypothetical protein